MRVLVLGASGFIGAAVCARLVAEGYSVRAGARRPQAAARRAPAGPEWIAADFDLMSTSEAWTGALLGIDAVVNCVGVLQDGLGDSSEAAHQTGPAALFEACRLSGVRRLIHLSAVGADEAAGTAYARSKLGTEQVLAQSELDWLVLRPSLVIGRTVFGGSALIRGLAGFPGLIPMVGGEQVFRPVGLEDLAGVIVQCLAPGGPSRAVLEVAGPEAVSLRDMLVAYRRWLGFAPARVISAPRWAAVPVLKIGDLLGWLGWASAFRSTSLRQMEFDVAGRSSGPSRWTLRPFSALLAEPSGVQDRWHARLYLVRPLAVAALVLFWLLTGAIAVGPGRDAAERTLETAGLGHFASAANLVGSTMDIALGLALLFRPWSRSAALLMAAASLVYLILGTILAPGLWGDPLGPWLKILPMMVLCLFVAATDDRR